MIKRPGERYRPGETQFKNDYQCPLEKPQHTPNILKKPPSADPPEALTNNKNQRQ